MTSWSDYVSAGFGMPPYLPGSVGGWGEEFLGLYNPSLKKCLKSLIFLPQES